jgi:hypothetical protein
MNGFSEVQHLMAKRKHHPLNTVLQKTTRGTEVPNPHSHIQSSIVPRCFYRREVTGFPEAQHLMAKIYPLKISTQNCSKKTRDTEWDGGTRFTLTHPVINRT